MTIPAIIPSKRAAADRPFANPMLWGVFLLYLIVLIYASICHHPWWDEINAWNIAKASNSFSDLLANERYEGHPPAWHTILWLISKFTDNIRYMQVAHAIIAGLAVFILLFFAPFPLVAKALIPFGYYFLFEYATLDRNYAPGVLAAFCICIVLQKEFKYKLLLYYVLLFLMSNTHLLAILLAGSLHLYFLVSMIEQGKRKRIVTLHAVAGILLVLPALYLIFPPTDSTISAHYWIKEWNVHKVTATITSPVRAFIPIPAWWKYNCWNTQFLLDSSDNYRVLKFIDPLLSMGLLGLVFFVLRKSRKSVVLFAANLICSMIVSIAVLTMTTERYAGFLFIGFIIAWWLYCYEVPRLWAGSPAANALLIIQLIAGIFFVVKTIRHPFSNLYRINELVKEVPAGERLVTDYGAMNPVVAYTKLPPYCVDVQKVVSSVKWDADIETLKNPRRYTDGVIALFREAGINKLYLISQASPYVLSTRDSLLPLSFHVQLIDKREGAVEKGSNLYLYCIRP